MGILYFDCFSGISGDMVLGALADLGADLNLVEKELNSFLPHEIRLDVNRVVINGIGSSSVTVRFNPTHRVAHLKDILNLVDCSPLEPREREFVCCVFNRLATCEAQIHGVSKEEVHFHEMGAIDTLVDVIGSCLALRQLSFHHYFASPVPLARGTISIMHGEYPLPAPAALALLKGVPCYGVDSELELVTPTGAALLTSLCDSFGPLPPMVVEGIGYGVGKNRRPDVPNVLRVIAGSAWESGVSELVGIIETNIDDMNPEIFSYIFERFFLQDGALDMYVHPVIMKKNRPGYMVQCLVRPSSIQRFIDFILKETSSTGVRYRLETRKALPRQKEWVTTHWGQVAIVRWNSPDGLPRVSPEYESCKMIAEKENLPLRMVFEEVFRCALGD